MKLCKICASKAEFIFQHGWSKASLTFPYYCCINDQCHFLFADCLDTLSDEQISAVYEDHWDSMSSEGSSDRALDKVNLVKGLLPHTRRVKVLDMGCGKGWGVETMRQAGVEAYGYDVTSPNVCSEYITVRDKESVTDSYNIITAIEVLEHLIDPIETIHWIASLLEEGGIFVFTTSTFNPRRHNANWWYLDIVGHISLHTNPSLKLLAQKTGFQVVADIWSTHIWIRADKVPLGAGVQLKTKHILRKVFDPISYSLMWNIINR
jgi:2-polyprenyl-3-methyl-5-hydroxy-6-metoxy-1,4-benzoquinol methylase